MANKSSVVEKNQKNMTKYLFNIKKSYTFAVV